MDFLNGRCNGPENVDDILLMKLSALFVAT